jgi:hypothetical protein
MSRFGGRENGKRVFPHPDKWAAERWLAAVIPGRDKVASPESITTGKETGTPIERY